MTNPGDLVPYGDDALVRRQDDTIRKMREASASRSLGSSQMGGGGVLQIDGDLRVNGGITLPGVLSSAGGLTATAGNISAPVGNVSAGGNVTAGAAISAAGLISGGGLSSGGAITAPGQISGGSGVFNGGLYSTDAYSFNITGTRVAGWHQIDGHIGTASSSERFKTHIVDADLVAKAEAILDCQLVYYNYRAEIAKRDDPEAPGYIGPDYKVHRELGMIAERLHEAGLWEFVVYERDVTTKDQVTVDDEGNETVTQVYAGDTLRLNADGEPIPYSIHYENFSLGVLAATQYLYGLWKVDHEQLEQNTEAIADLQRRLG